MSAGDRFLLEQFGLDYAAYVALLRGLDDLDKVTR